MSKSSQYEPLASRLFRRVPRLVQTAA